MSIERRLKKLEITTMPPKHLPRRTYRVGAMTPEEGEAAIAKLVAEGVNRKDILLILAAGAPPTSHMFEKYRWEGRWVPKDGRDQEAQSDQDSGE